MYKKVSAVFIIAIVLFFSCKTTPKEDPNCLGDFSPQPMAKLIGGTVKRTKNEIKPAEFTFVLYPRTNIVAFHHKFLGDNIWIDLNEEARKVIIEGMQKYLDDYKNKNISSKNDKKKAYYGKAPIEMGWGVLGVSRSARAILRCEYQLLTSNRPYFILGNATAKSTDGANCPATRMAFSPAQCLNVIEVLKQENILKLVGEMQKEFDKYGMVEDADIQSEIENSAKESSEEDVVNYDDDF